MASKYSTQRAAVGTIEKIPLGLIRPFRNQPRKYFDPQALKELADSIKEEGQITPAWVMPIYDDNDPGCHYELIAGERRWRACAIAGKATLIAEIRATETAEAQYLDSVMENYGRRDCTPLETARAIEEMRRIRFGETIEWGDKVVEKLATIFVHSTAWINQHRSLLRLHPEVQAMMEPDVPEDRRLSFQVAVPLANLQPDVQLALASEIIRNGMSTKQALSHVRNKVTNEMRISKKGKLRSPVRDYDILVRFLKNLGESAESLLGMPRSRFEEMFRSRPTKELRDVVAVLNKRLGELRDLQQILIRVEKARTEPQAVYVPPTAKSTRVLQ